MKQLLLSVYNMHLFADPYPFANVIFLVHSAQYLMNKGQVTPKHTLRMWLKMK